MALDAAALQRLVVLRVGDVDPETGDPTTLNDGIVAANVALLWEAYADKAVIAPRLQELYVRRAAIEMVLGILAPRVDFSADGLSIKRSQQVAAYQAKLEATVVELQTVEKLALGSRRPAVGQITTVEPISPPFTGAPNGNDPRYSGSVYAGRGDGDI